MSRNILTIENFGQIKHGEISFADLTVFVGPQATGKSIILQLLKLIIDSTSIRYELRRHGIEWHKQTNNFLNIFFGEGMQSLWKKDISRIQWNGNTQSLNLIQSGKIQNSSENLFFIPAQRVLTLRDGLPRNFGDYRIGDPFVVRSFSEKVRLLLEEYSSSASIFPKTNRLKSEIRNQLSKNILSGMNLQLDAVSLQKRLLLNSTDNSTKLPFMVWSAGQREFIPLLLGLYWLSPAGKTSKRKGIDWVVIEEPEMGLHPKAISSVLLLILDILSRGYKICLSTHSPHILDVIWALKNFKENGADFSSILSIFELEKNNVTTALANNVLNKSLAVYCFNNNGNIEDISELDPNSDSLSESGWGGLSDFSGHVANIVAEVISSRNPEN